MSNYVLSPGTYRELQRLINERGLVGGGSTGKPGTRHVSWVKCTSTTADADGYYPALARSYDTTTGTWTDYDECLMMLSDDSTPEADKTYAGIRAGDTTTYATPLFVCVVGGGGDSSFLAVLTAKDYDRNPFITYSWRGVDQSGFDGSALVYTTNNLSGDPDNNPAFSVTNRDLPVWPETTYGEQVDHLSVVRLRLGEGGYYVFAEEPWIDLFRRTGLSDADGEIVYLRRWNQNTQAWEDADECRMIEAG